MRSLAPPFLAPFLLALSLGPAVAQPVTGTDWQLLAIDGKLVDLAMTATLRIEADGQVGGQAPCNRWSARNGAALPALNLAAIRATRMACERLADEQAFFKALAAMTEVREEGGRNLILTGSGGRTMEFVTERMDSLTRCLTCLPPE